MSEKDSNPDQDQNESAAPDPDADTAQRETATVKTKQEENIESEDELAGEEVQSTVDLEIEDAIAKSAISEKKARQKKQRIRIAGALAGVLFFAWAGWYLFAPFKGGMDFGLCKVFVQLNVRYPQTIHFSKVENFGNSIRIWYAHMDSFGEYRLEPIQCTFTQGENGQLMVDKITISRREIPQERIDAFNRSVPAIYANPPDLTYPSPLPDSLRDLQLETSRFRTPIL